MRSIQTVSTLIAMGALLAGPTSPPRVIADDALPPAANAEKSIRVDGSPMPAPAMPAEATSAQAEFDRTFTKWKALLGQLRDLRREFSAATNASEETHRELVERYTKLMKDGQKLLPEVIDAAAQSYQAQRGKDADLTQFLVEIARDEANRDGYETAARIARLLVENGQRQQKLLEVAGIASFHISDFNAAEKYLNEAAQAGALSKDAKQLLPQLAYEKKAWEREKKLREAEAKADDLPRVKIETSRGDMVIELFENEAPNTVANFISLVDKGFYNALTFHRVLPGFMAQGGCPQGDGTGGPGYSIRGEASDEKVYRRHFRGCISMALGDNPDSGGSQFFITFVPTNGLDGKHTVFGRVIEGIDVLSRIQRRDPEAATGPGDTITKATVIRKRDHKYEPQRVN